MKTKTSQNNKVHNRRKKLKEPTYIPLAERISDRGESTLRSLSEDRWLAVFEDGRKKWIGAKAGARFCAMVQYILGSEGHTIAAVVILDPMGRSLHGQFCGVEKDKKFIGKLLLKTYSDVIVVG